METIVLDAVQTMTESGTAGESATNPTPKRKVARTQPKRHNKASVSGAKKKRNEGDISGANTEVIDNTSEASDAAEEVSVPSKTPGGQAKQAPGNNEVYKMAKFFKPDPFPPNLPSPEKYQAWRLWKKQFMVALELSGETSQRNKANFLVISVGEEVRQLIFTLDLLPDAVPGETKPVFDILVQGLETHFKGTSDETVDLTAFNTMKQGEKEGARDFHIRLMRQANLCGFLGQESLIKARFVTGMRDRKAAEQAFSQNWDLLQTVSVAARNEAAAAAESLNTSSTPKAVEVAEISSRFPHYAGARGGFTRGGLTRGGFPRGNFWKGAGSGSSGGDCKGCGRKGGHEQGFKCSAATASCRSCGKRGHFARVCRGKLHEITNKEVKTEGDKEVLNMN